MKITGATINASDSEEDEGDDVIAGGDSDDAIESDDEDEESEIELQEAEDAENEDNMTEDENENDQPANSDGDVLIWKRQDARAKVDRDWKYEKGGVKETPYARAKTPSQVLNVNTNEWEEISAFEILMRNIPEGELELWAELTNPLLVAAGLPETSVQEMQQLLGVLAALTQSSKVGGATKAFEREIDGLFPAADLGRFGMTLRRYQHLLHN